MTLIHEIAEDARREMLQCQRAAIREGAKYYARSRVTRASTLHHMGIIAEPALPILKNHLRSLMQAHKSRSWRYSQARYIAVMQCIGGELILADSVTRFKSRSLELEAAQ